MAKKGRRAPPAKASRKRVWWAVGAAIVVAVTAGLLLLRPPPAAPIDPEGDPSFGRADAPVVVYYFGDFQCPHCRRFELEGPFERLRAYAADGSVRIVAKAFPILGDDSWSAAQAAQYVWETAPEDYWAWHEGLFEIQGAERSGWASADRIVAYSARFSSIDETGLRAAMASTAYRAESQADYDDGAGHGVVSTPSLVIDGRAYRALDEAATRAAIEAALAEARA